MFRRWVLAACIAGIGACIAFFFLDIKPVSVLCSEGFALLARKGGDATENAEAAYNSFDRAVTLAPSCAVCYFGRGVSLYRQFYFWAKTNILDIEHPGLSEDIAQIMWDNLTKAIELDPNLAEAYFFRGLVTLNLLARSKSVDIDDFSAALSLNDPQSTHWGLYTHEDIYYWRGMAWARREGCLNEAIAAGWLTRRWAGRSFLRLRISTRSFRWTQRPPPPITTGPFCARSLDSMTALSPIWSGWSTLSTVRLPMHSTEATLISTRTKVSVRKERSFSRSGEPDSGGPATSPPIHANVVRYPSYHWRLS